MRPAFLALWPTWTVFPLVSLAVLVLGAQAGETALITTGLGLFALNVVLLVDYAYFTTLELDGDTLVFRTHYGLREERMPVGAIQRIDAKRYPAAHSTVSAPNLVVRGRASTLRVNIKTYRLADLRAVIEAVRGMNPAVQLDDFWGAVVEGRDPYAIPVPRSRW